MDERVIAQAIQAGLIQNPDEVLDFGLETLRGRLMARDRFRTATLEARVKAFEDLLAGSESNATLPFQHENWYPDR